MERVLKIDFKVINKPKSNIPYFIEITGVELKNKGTEELILSYRYAFHTGAYQCNFEYIGVYNESNIIVLHERNKNELLLRVEEVIFRFYDSSTCDEIFRFNVKRDLMINGRFNIFDLVRGILWGQIINELNNKSDN